MSDRRARTPYAVFVVASHNNLKLYFCSNKHVPTHIPPNPHRLHQELGLFISH